MRNLNKKKIAPLIFAAILCILIPGCKKQDSWLNVKNNKRSVVPETLADYQAILDNFDSFNKISSTAGTASSDDFYLTSSGYLSSGETDRNLYVWNQAIWSGGESPEWNFHYRAIGLANIVLEGISSINENTSLQNNIKGQAYFFRALSYYTLVQLFCKPFDVNAPSNMGLPMRMASDVNIISQRATITATYQQIINDAIEASKLLLGNQPYNSRPTPVAAYALLAKIYLNMGDYETAGQYANAVLKLNDRLLDYNNTSVVGNSRTYRFLAYGKSNPEILFYAEGGSYSPVYPATSSTGFVTPELYSLYDQNDLRKSIFFTPVGSDIKYRGSYSGRLYNFGGLATNEVYLIAAECFARQGNTDRAVELLNKLLIKRYVTGTFINRMVSDAEQALGMVLTERRKEMAFIGNIRWEDLRRLNKDVRFRTTLTRTLNGQTYTLLPDEKRYTLPIPQNEIQLSGIQQNER